MARVKREFFPNADVASSTVEIADLVGVGEIAVLVHIGHRDAGVQAQSTDGGAARKIRGVRRTQDIVDGAAVSDHHRVECGAVG